MKLLNNMETVRLDTSYDLLLDKTKSTNTESEIKNIKQPVNHIYFVICNSCYWCATYFGTDDLESSSHVLNCHACNSHDTELIPIGTDESFRIEYGHARGMEIEFCKSHK